MPTLLVDCPYTHRKFSTGVETTEESLRVIEGGPAISTVERRRVAAGRGATCALPVSTVECRRIAAGRGSTYAPSISPVEPGLLSCSRLVDRKADEAQGHGQN